MLLMKQTRGKPGERLFSIFIINKYVISKLIRRKYLYKRYGKKQNWLKDKRKNLLVYNLKKYKLKFVIRRGLTLPFCITSVQSNTAMSEMKLKFVAMLASDRQKKNFG